ncbi:hypothetical protein EK21DRAFT_95397 [Setomelanomma holmii]|uniref:Uncharacterized protein n=1 Tax=Setomelanomma holmii TaxID=210430 RepID=A0A9P4GVN7_9PLEO|nr:hypothetical protein EK21DRAFT_95397 [Setomelanomma holmii]
MNSSILILPSWTPKKRLSGLLQTPRQTIYYLRCMNLWIAMVEKEYKWLMINVRLAPKFTSAVRSLKNLEKSFQSLEDRETKFGFLDRYFDDAADILNLQLNLEHNEFNQHAHGLNLQTNLISHETQELNRRSTEAAIVNSKASEKTSWTMLVNMVLLWITAPTTLLLQYFGSEKAMFSFERNPRTFLIAVVVMFTVLPLLTSAIYLFQRSHRSLLWLMGFRTKGSSQSHDDEKESSNLQHCPTQAAYCGTVEPEVKL